MLQEQQLIELCQKGDRQAMHQLYSTSVGYLGAIVQRYLGRCDEMKDVLQDSYIKIFGSIRQFNYQGDGSIRAWMSRITVNESLAFLRQRMQNKWIEQVEQLPDVVDDECDPLVNDIPPQVLQDLITRLPVGYRTVLNLYVFEGKSHAEIAKLLGIKPTSSASQLCHAKSLLRSWIDNYLKTNAI